VARERTILYPLLDEFKPIRFVVPDAIGALHASELARLDATLAPDEDADLGGELSCLFLWMGRGLTLHCGVCGCGG
jgi:hypothetical protein